MFKRRTKTWIWVAISIAFILLLTVILYRANIGVGITPEIGYEIPDQTAENTVLYTEVSDHIGERLWVEGEIDHVFVSNNNNFFLNFCPDFRDCSFNSVIFSNQSHLFDDIESWSGELVHIYGEIGIYENRPQIIIEHPDQVEIEIGKEDGEIKDEVLFEVMRIIDGDTIQVRINNSPELVRLIGIDTPEISGPYTEEECFGPEASERVTELLKGEYVVLLKDPHTEDRDQYDRLLRYVFTKEGENINALLLEEGYAHYFPYESFAFQDHFETLETQAQTQNLGLWSTCGN